jgi:hypothetical protein
MSKFEKLTNVEHNKKIHTLVSMNHLGQKIPILFDKQVYKIIDKLDKKWYVNDKNHVYCMHMKNGESYPIYAHEIVAKLGMTKENSQRVPIIHINNIHFDNRLENLQYDIVEKDHSKNTKKKKRTIDLNKHNINVESLPTYVWYLKPDKTHGSRFIVDIPNETSWRSTASKKVSLRYKLEEAKKYLRHTQEKRPDIFETYSMNGDLTARGLKLYKEYRKIIELAGFTMDRMPNNNTQKSLVEDISDLTEFEEYLLHSYEPSHGSININRKMKDYFS